MASKEVYDQKAFATEEEALAFSAAYRRDMWAYDGDATAYPMPDGTFVVYMRRRESCD